MYFLTFIPSQYHFSSQEVLQWNASNLQQEASSILDPSGAHPHSGAMHADNHPAQTSVSRNASAIINGSADH